MKRWIKTILVMVVVLGLLGGAVYGYYYYFGPGGSQDTAYRSEPVKRGDLLVSISQTGTVEPEEVIDVGARVAGEILEFGKDANGNQVDYNSPVKAGMVLARIDDSLWKIAAAQADAQVLSAKATLQHAKADLGQLKAKLVQAELDWQRARKLGPGDALAKSSYDAYESAYEVAKANVAVGEATIAQAEAGIAQAETAVATARRNLGYCTITSPVDGVIIDRRVNMGQTVVASLNAPSLFLIAKDLRRMQVWVPVNEADICKLHPGQPVSFTVDAMPDATFRGRVGKIRLNASMTQNVVTYTVEVQTDNSDGLLMPYLTANVRFELARRDDVLMAPSQALQWTPTSIDQVAPEARAAYEARLARRSGKREAGAAAGSSAPWQAAAREPASSGPATSGPAGDSGKARRGGQGSRGVLWVVSGKFVRPIEVRTGLTNGAETEVSGEGLDEGMEVVTGAAVQSGSSASGVNPFAPRPPGSSKSGTGSNKGGPPPM
jgi:HlyD family secretion protein